MCQILNALLYQIYMLHDTQLAAFAEWAESRNPSRIVMESTGVLRRSPYQALEDCGFTSQKLVLANACDGKERKVTRLTSLMQNIWRLSVAWMP